MPSYRGLRHPRCPQPYLLAAAAKLHGEHGYSSVPPDREHQRPKYRPKHLVPRLFRHSLVQQLHARRPRELDPDQQGPARPAHRLATTPGGGACCVISFFFSCLIFRITTYY